MAATEPVHVINGVELPRYMGRWYEIACIPSIFQPRSTTNTRATYTLEDDGKTVRVLNETFAGDSRKYIQGKAWKVDPSTEEAKFMVEFMVPPFLPIFRKQGDYWIMALDKDGYSYALVGQPTRKFLWVLSREPSMSDDVYKMLLDIATKQGYDVSTLVKTEHKEGVGEAVTDTAKTDSGFWWLKALFGK